MNKSAAVDTHLSRKSAGYLQTPGKFTAASLLLEGHDYSPVAVGDGGGGQFGGYNAVWSGSIVRQQTGPMSAQYLRNDGSVRTIVGASAAGGTAGVEMLTVSSAGVATNCGGNAPTGALDVCGERSGCAMRRPRHQPARLVMLASQHGIRITNIAALRRTHGSATQFRRGDAWQRAPSYA